MPSSAIKQEMVGYNSGWGYRAGDGRRLSGKQKAVSYGPLYLYCIYHAPTIFDW